MRLISCLVVMIVALAAASPTGIFDGQNDVGAVVNAGSVEYDATLKTYALVGSGENM